ncbi:ribosomal L28e protein family-domain-containing protein [Hysterangium stoloniferum]|nr:ribosomal L28e protein family-domain-containing protein [Hysterangium stoloniferum]
MSTDLQWLLIRKSNSYLVDRVPEGPVFSREPGNLRNIHSHKYSGVANSKTIAIQDTPTGVQITTRKPKASPHQVRGAAHKISIRGNSGNRRAVGIVAGLAKRGYRPDLRAAAVARVSTLLSARRNKVTISAQPVREKKVRGSKKGKAVKGLD